MIDMSTDETLETLGTSLMVLFEANSPQMSLFDFDGAKNMVFFASQTPVFMGSIVCSAEGAGLHRHCTHQFVLSENLTHTAAQLVKPRPSRFVVQLQLARQFLGRQAAFAGDK